MGIKTNLLFQSTGGGDPAAGYALVLLGFRVWSNSSRFWFGEGKMDLMAVKIRGMVSSGSKQ